MERKRNAVAERMEEYAEEEDQYSDEDEDELLKIEAEDSPDMNKSDFNISQIE